MTEYAVEYGTDMHGAGFVGGDSVFVDHTGQVELVPGQEDERAGWPIVARVEPTGLAKLAALVSDPATRALTSVPPSREGDMRVLAIRTPGWQQELRLAEVPDAAAPLLRAIVDLGERARAKGTAVTPLADYVLTVRRENRGGRMRRHGTLTVRATGEIELAPPNAEPIRKRVDPAALVPVARLLASPTLQALRCRNQPVEGFYWIAEIAAPGLKAELRCVGLLPRPAHLLDQALWQLRAHADLPRD